MTAFVVYMLSLLLCAGQKEEGSAQTAQLCQHVGQPDAGHANSAARTSASESREISSRIMATPGPATALK